MSFLTSIFSVFVSSWNGRNDNYAAIIDVFSRRYLTDSIRYETDDAFMSAYMTEFFRLPGQEKILVQLETEFLWELNVGSIAKSSF